jgi:hypothetical protein
MSPVTMPPVTRTAPASALLDQLSPLFEGVSLAKQPAQAGIGATPVRIGPEVEASDQHFRSGRAAAASSAGVQLRD